MHYLLIYDLVPDHFERREELRDENLELGWDFHDKNVPILGGPLKEPADQTFLLFQSNCPESSEKFARHDPYVKNGIVKSWKVRPWITVVGKEATSPVR